MSIEYSFGPMVKTTYYGPTNALGSRIIAINTRTHERHTQTYRHELSSSENHASAAGFLLKTNSLAAADMGKDGSYYWMPKQYRSAKYVVGR